MAESLRVTHGGDIAWKAAAELPHSETGERVAGLRVVR